MTAIWRKTGARRLFKGLLGLLGLLLLASAILTAVRVVASGGGSTPVLLLCLVLVGFAVGAMWLGFATVDRHFDELERLRGLLHIAAGREDPLPPEWPGLTAVGAEAAALGNAARRAIVAQRALAGRNDERLAAVVAAAAEGLVVITDTGLVSLVNDAALKVLGKRGLAVGTSVYAVLDRDVLAEVEHGIRQTGESVRAELALVDGAGLEALVAPLGDHGGFVVSLPHREPGPRTLVHHDLALHDNPPAMRVDPEQPPYDWPLEDLPVLVLDTETTGLDVAIARIVSLGGVRSHGQRTYPRCNTDLLVNPGLPIPAQSTAIHGISNSMVADAPGFAEAWESLAAALDGKVIVGHSIGFDLAVLKAECERHRLPWSLPPALDVALLYGALQPEDGHGGLDALAERFGVPVEGRHTALGDALVTAEIWIALIARLRERGVSTYGDAREFSMNAGLLLARQRQAGWLPAARNENKGQ